MGFSFQPFDDPRSLLDQLHNTQAKSKDEAGDDNGVKFIHHQIIHQKDKFSGSIRAIELDK